MNLIVEGKHAEINIYRKPAKVFFPVSEIVFTVVFIKI